MTRTGETAVVFATKRVAGGDMHDAGEGSRRQSIEGDSRLEGGEGGGGVTDNILTESA